MKIGQKVKSVQFQTVPHLPGLAGVVVSTLDSEINNCEMHVEPAGVYCKATTKPRDQSEPQTHHFLFPYGNIVRIHMEPPPEVETAPAAKMEPLQPKASKGKLPQVEGMAF